jgi:hypothetical protein
MMAIFGARLLEPDIGDSVPRDALLHESKEKLIAYKSTIYLGQSVPLLPPWKHKKMIDPRRQGVYIERCHPETGMHRSVGASIRSFLASY